jgi:hypothetical protein
MQRSVLTGQRLITETAQNGGFRFKWVMVTLTYRPEVEWSPKHVSSLLTHMREWCKRRNIPFRNVWVAEMQKQRGVIHYHILLMLPAAGSCRKLPMPDKQGWWPHGSTRIETARCAGGYLAKYASKGDLTPFPKGARIHGCGGLTGGALSTWRWWKRPKYVRDAMPDASTPVRRLPRGGWMNIETGECIQSEWQYAGMRRGKIILIPKTSDLQIQMVARYQFDHAGALSQVAE